MKSFGGITSPFDNAVAPVHSAGDAALGGTTGGLPLDGASKQTGGETGQHVTTVNVRDSDTKPGPDAHAIKGS